MAALSAAALVYGYEAPAVRKRFGEPAERPWLAVPRAAAVTLPWIHRLSATVLALGPWSLLYALFSRMPAPTGAAELRFTWESTLPLPGWAVWAYSLAYPVVVATPLLMSNAVILRRFVLAGWLGTLLGFSCMLVLPGTVELRAGQFDGLTQALLSGNRALDAGWLAFPSFHIFWVALSAAALTMRWPRAQWPCAVLVALTAVSCLLTGSHALVDVAGGLALAWFAWRADAVWLKLLALVERLANSWSAFRLGSVRIISHAVWSASAAVAGALVVLYLAGPTACGATAGLVATGLIAAGAWGYWLEGGDKLARPFGYYGYVFGSLAGLLVLAALDWPGFDALLAAFAAAAPVAQAIGRLRCVVQGCCHGRLVLPAYFGIHVTHRQSRVTALSGLSGVAIHPTPLYSIVANLFLAAILLRLWVAETPWTVIGGAYLALSSLARFVEEQYRGEAQTAHCAGLAIYQWLAIGFFVTGLVMMGLPAAAVTPAGSLSMTSVVVALGCGAAAAFLMSVDFPLSRARWSRLTVLP